jgi:hypothetical protein
MSRVGLFAILALLGAAGGCSTVKPGQTVLDNAFDANRSFNGDLRSSSDDEMVLAVSASARDDYAPAYSLAIAYRCLPNGPAGEWQCSYSARMLRTGPTVSDGFEKSLLLYAQAQESKNASEMKRHLDDGALEWLEADVASCPNGIFAMDSIRVANWRPDTHYALLDVGDREVILHPAAIRVTMHGVYTTTTYEGWLLAGGVPAAVQKLVETLEPCWKPATSPRPWNRPER